MGLAAHGIIIIEQLIVIIIFLPPSLHSIIIQTLENEHSSNLAYGVVSHDQAREGGGGGGGEGGGEETQAYELVAMTQPGHTHPGPLQQPAPPAPSTRLVVSMPYHRLVQELGWRNQPMQSSLINRTCRTEHAVLYSIIIHVQCQTKHCI